MKVKVEVEEGGILPSWYYCTAWYDGSTRKNVMYIVGLHWLMRKWNRVVEWWWREIVGGMWNGSRMICPMCRRDWEIKRKKLSKIETISEVKFGEFKRVK